MNRVARQAYLRTRLAIMSGKLMGPERIGELSQLSFEELSETSGFDQISGDSISARLAVYERSMTQDWLDELSALLRPLEGPARRLLTQWASRYELLNIKALVRGKIGQLPNDEIEKNLFKLPGFLSLNHDALLNTDSVPELLRQLQQTCYRRIATQALSRYETKPDPFFLDATLDQQFYSELIDRARQLGDDDRDETLKLIGRIVDRHNLIWSLRYRYHYGLQPSEIIYLSIDGGRLINRGLMQTMLQSDTLQEALQHVPESMLDDEHPAVTITLLDAVVRCDLLNYASRAMRRSPSVVTGVLAYLVLRWGEITELYALVHARADGFSDEVLFDAMNPLQEKLS